jgi:hypothetical protein
MPRQHHIQERNTAIANVLYDLERAIELVRHAHHLNQVNALGLDLPSEKPLAETITQVVQTYRQPTEATGG